MLVIVPNTFPFVGVSKNAARNSYGGISGRRFLAQMKIDPAAIAIALAL